MDTFGTVFFFFFVDFYVSCENFDSDVAFLSRAAECATASIRKDNLMEMKSGIGVKHKVATGRNGI